MPDRASPAPAHDETTLCAEIARLNKIVQVLMNRAERSASVQSSDFGLFQTAVLLEEQVRRRTGELEAALRENEKINRTLQLEIRERERAQDALRQSEERYHAAAEAALDAFITIDESYAIVVVNSAAERIFGYPAAELLGRNLVVLLPAATRDRSVEAIGGYLQTRANRPPWQGLQLTCLRKDGREIPVEFSFGEFRHGERRYYTGVARDISERQRAERALQALQDQLRQQAIRDPLTGLYNRRYLNEALYRELVRAERYGQPVSVIMGDIDRFKTINDTHGHHAGDEVLKAFGELLMPDAAAATSAVATAARSSCWSTPTWPRTTRCGVRSSCAPSSPPHPSRTARPSSAPPRHSALPSFRRTGRPAMH
jgi:PAS domain S-box-containing protein